MNNSAQVNTGVKKSKLKKPIIIGAVVFIVLIIIGYIYYRYLNYTNKCEESTIGYKNAEEKITKLKSDLKKQNDKLNIPDCANIDGSAAIETPCKIYSDDVSSLRTALHDIRTQLQTKEFEVINLTKRINDIPSVEQTPQYINKVREFERLNTEYEELDKNVKAKEVTIAGLNARILLLETQTQQIISSSECQTQNEQLDALQILYQSALDDVSAKQLEFNMMKNLMDHYKAESIHYKAESIRYKNDFERVQVENQDLRSDVQKCNQCNIPGHCLINDPSYQWSDTSNGFLRWDECCLPLPPRTKNYGGAPSTCPEMMNDLCDSSSQAHRKLCIKK